MSIEVDMGTCFIEIIWGGVETAVFSILKKIKAYIKKEWNSDTRYNMDESWKCIGYNKLNTKGEIPYDST